MECLCVNATRNKCANGFSFPLSLSPLPRRVVSIYRMSRARTFLTRTTTHARTHTFALTSTTAHVKRHGETRNRLQLDSTELAGRQAAKLGRSSKESCLLSLDSSPPLALSLFLSRALSHFAYLPLLSSSLPDRFHPSPMHCRIASRRYILRIAESRVWGLALQVLALGTSERRGKIRREIHFYHYFDIITYASENLYVRLINFIRFNEKIARTLPP